MPAKKAKQNVKSNKPNNLVVTKSNNKKKNTKSSSAKNASLVPTKNKKNNQEQVIKIVTKYKDVPLNELYNDLEGMKQYRAVLLERRDELIKAKSIIDSNKRKIAIQKTLENTYDIQFKLQDATFKNHYVPHGFSVINKQQETPNNNLHDRVMQRSQERELTTQQPVVIHHKERTEPPKQVVHNHYHTTIINNEQKPIQPVQQHPQPVQQGFIPQTITLYPQVQPTTQIEISKPKYSIVWPLYERIKELIKPRKYSSIIFPFIIIATILVAASLAFIIIWGFSVGWSKFGDDVFGSIAEFFENVF